jgi:micrococcal nuclease
MFTYEAFISKVVDGDTVKADIDLGFNVVLKDQVFRLYGINAPEKKGESKFEGEKSKERLSQLILGRTVKVKTYKDKKEKYGRILVQIFLDEENINELLVQEGLASVYIL